MKRINKRELFIFILGVIISGTSVYAATLLANSISYDNTSSGINANNVQDAIDSLYTKANNPTIPSDYKYLPTTTTATSNDILNGKTAYNNLGELITGTISTNCIYGNIVINNDAFSSGQLIEDTVTPNIIFMEWPDRVVVYNKNNSATNVTMYLKSGSPTTRSLSQNFDVDGNKLYLKLTNNDHLNKTFMYMVCS